MIDIVREIEAVQREVGSGRIAAGEGRAVRLRRTYDAPIDDVWDALTEPERIGRWFLPISGDYRARRPLPVRGQRRRRDRRLRAPEQVAGHVGLRGDGQSRRRLGDRGAALAGGRRSDDRSSWSTSPSCPTTAGTEYGPGAVGVGWDKGLLGLALHLRGESLEDPMAWQMSRRRTRYFAGAARRGVRRTLPPARIRRPRLRPSRTRPRSTRRTRTPVPRAQPPHTPRASHRSVGRGVGHPPCGGAWLRPSPAWATLLRLEDPDGVAERVADAHVGAVEVVRGLLGEVGDAALLEGLVQRPGVVGVEDEAAHGALGDQLAELLGGRLVVERRAGLLEGDLASGFAGDAHGQPAVVALLEVLALLEAELVDVEVERLVLVEDLDRTRRSSLVIIGSFLRCGSVWDDPIAREPRPRWLLRNCSIARRDARRAPAAAWPPSGRSWAPRSARAPRGTPTATRRRSRGTSG